MLNDTTMQTEMGQQFMEAWIVAGVELMSGHELDKEQTLGLDVVAEGVAPFGWGIKVSDINPQLKETLKATAKAAFPSVVPMLEMLQKEGEDEQGA